MNRYDVLGLRDDATAEEIKKAYRKLAAKTHPDRNGEEMTPLFRSVQDAYETLSNPDKRAAYDRELNGPPTQPEPAAPAPQYSYPKEEDHAAYAEEDRSFAGATAPAARRNQALRWIKRLLIAGAFIGVGTAWLLHDIRIFQLVPPKDGLHFAVFQGLPGIVYTVLWAFGTLVAAVAYDVGTAMKVPVGCAVISGGFAFITGAGTGEIWLPALITGVVFSYLIGVAVRLRARIAAWPR